MIDLTSKGKFYFDKRDGSGHFQMCVLLKLLPNVHRPKQKWVMLQNNLLPAWTLNNFIKEVLKTAEIVFQTE